MKLEDSWIKARESWDFRGEQRPDFAIEPRADQESVWDYPRPPVIVDDKRAIEVRSSSGRLLLKTNAARRVLETASPPTFYLPAQDLCVALEPANGRSFCEWKGAAEYFQFEDEVIAWRYPEPFDSFTSVAGWICFYPALTQCSVDGEAVRAQAGGFYGGWVTDEIIGPYKGEPGTSGW
jgi:uncharacterized protein (DUF427 family)